MSTYCNLAEERAALQAAITAKFEMTLGDPSKYELVQDEIDGPLKQLEALEEEEDEQDRANGLEPPKEHVSSPLSPLLSPIPEADEDDVSDFSLPLSRSDSESHSDGSDGEATSEDGSEASGEDPGTPMLCFRYCKVEDCKLCKVKYQPKEY
ncbi:hypothetical protein BJX96DRAFT_179842 [Aspergillus floccosus]